MMQPNLRFSDFAGEWKQTILAEVIEDKPKNGYSPEAVDFETPNKVLSISAVTTGVFDDTCFKYTEFQGEDEADYWVRNEDILIQRSNTIDLVGVSAIYRGEDNQFIYPDLLMKVHAQKDVDSYFLSYYLNTPKIRNYFKRNAAGTSGNMPKINQKVVSSAPICMPEINEQRKVSALLSTIDDEVRNEDQLLESLKRQRKELIRRILKREIRLPQCEDLPEWLGITLSDALEEKVRKAKKDGKYEHLSLTKEGVCPKSERYERDFLVTTDEKEYKITDVDDICYNPANLKFGVICRNKYKTGIFSPIYITFKVKEGFLPEFIEMVVTSEGFINRALKFQEGTVYERMAVKPADLMTMRIEVPSISEQKKIVNCIKQFDDAIEIHKELSLRLRKVKKGLLQEMFV